MATRLQGRHRAVRRRRPRRLPGRRAAARSPSGCRTRTASPVRRRRPARPAGAINAAAIAAGAPDFGRRDRAPPRPVEQCVRARHLPDGRDEHRGVGRPLARLLHPRVAPPPTGEPARQRAARGGFCKRVVPFGGGAGSALDSGALDALAITAMSYRSGMSVTFCEARTDVELWSALAAGWRARDARRAASARIERDSVRVSARRHRRRVLRRWQRSGRSRRRARRFTWAPTASSSSASARSTRAPRRTVEHAPPSMAQIGGQVLASIFTDSLGTDLEKVRLVNTAVQPDSARTARGKSPVPLRDVALCTVTPSVAARGHRARLRGRAPAHDPHCCCTASAARTRAVRAFLSYLLFAPGFCKALMALGRADARIKRAEIDALIAPRPHVGPARPRPGSRRTSRRDPGRSAPGSSPHSRWLRPARVSSTRSTARRRRPGARDR